MFSLKTVLPGIATIIASGLIVSHMQGQCSNPDTMYMRFASNASALSGTVKHCELNLPCTITMIPPVGDSAAIIPLTVPGNITLGSAYQAIHGVTVYNFSNVNNYAISADCPSDDGDIGLGNSSTDSGSLLQGLVTWTGHSIDLKCIPAPEGDDGGKVGCDSVEMTNGLAVNGIALPVGTYPAGTSFPVTGKIKDSGCTFGTETFSGSLTLQDSSVLGSGTENLTLLTSGMHLTGHATCASPGLGTIFTTQYDLKVGGNIIKSKLDYGTSSGSFKMSVGSLQLTAQLAQ